MANNPYVNKVVYGNQTVMDISDTTAEEEDVVSGKTFYKADGAKGVGRAVIPSTDDCYKTTDDEAYAIGDNDYFPYYSDSLSAKVKISWYNFKARLKAYFDTIYAQFAGTEAELRDTVGWTGKNLYPLTLDSLKELNTSGTWSGNVYTLNSVMFTVSTNADGYVTAVTTSGTASAQTSFYFISSTVGGISDYLPSGNYIMNGCANGGSLTGSFRMDFDIGTTMNVATDSSDKSFSIPSDSSLLVFWTIGISSGQSMASKTFYPMIRKATIGSNTFEPYHLSVEQCKFDRAEQRVLGAKNLCESKCPTETINGITFTKNNDGSYTISGTNDGSNTSTMRIDQSTKTGVDNLKNYHGRYTLSLKDANGNGVNVAFIMMQNSTWTSGLFLSSNAGEVTGDVNLDNCFLYITVAKNVSFSSPITVYPMLRLASDPDDTYAPYAMTNKELTDKVQTVYKTATVDSSGMVTFTGVDTSKSYSIEADYGTDWNAPPVTYTKIQISGTTLIYTLSGANNGQTIRLIDKKY